MIIQELEEIFETFPKFRMNRIKFVITQGKISNKNCKKFG